MFFPHHFPDECYTAFSCGSWLLDPQLLEYLPGDSNIVRFQRRFELEPYEEPEGLDADVEVLRFAFRTLTTPLDQLPRRTLLQRAIIDHEAVVDHFVPDIDGRAEKRDGALDDVDGAIDPRAESARISE